MKKPIVLLAIASLTASPVAASGVRDAAFSSSGDRAHAETGIFVGATYRVGFGRQRSATRARASLKVSGMMQASDRSELRFGEGLEIAANSNGRPAMLIGGAELGDIKNAARLNGTTTAVVVLAGVALVAGAVVLATYCDNDCDNAKNE